MRYTREYLEEKYKNDPEQLDEVLGWLGKKAKEYGGKALSAAGKLVGKLVQQSVDPDSARPAAAGFGGEADPTMARARRAVASRLGPASNIKRQNSKYAKTNHSEAAAKKAKEAEEGAVSSDLEKAFMERRKSK